MKKRGWLIVLELLGELFVTMLCMALGLLILESFGVDLTAIDYDLVILLGLVVMVAFFGAVTSLVQWLKKKCRKGVTK